jgi:predicted protein tyrosine phosphatase
MKELIVCGVAEIPGCVDRATAAISIWDPGLKDSDFQAAAIESLPPDLLLLHFDDVQISAGGRVAPSLEHAEAIVDFARDLPDDSTLLVHCWAGISRSTAAGFLALCAMGVDPDEATARVGKVRSTLWPHRGLVEWGAFALEDQRVIPAMDRYLARLPWRKGPAD